MLEREWVKTIYPCCRRPARFLCFLDVPKQGFDRRCPRCDRYWNVTVKFMRRGRGWTMRAVEWCLLSTPAGAPPMIPLDA